MTQITTVWGVYTRGKRPGQVQADVQTAKSLASGGYTEPGGATLKLENLPLATGPTEHASSGGTDQQLSTQTSRRSGEQWLRWCYHFGVVSRPATYWLKALSPLEIGITNFFPAA
ncbi:hypothetical protein HispidOSU_020240 [Sigmodon hispidus]